MRCVAYVRVSTDEQASSGGGMSAQLDAIRAEAAKRGWTIIDVLSDAGYSAQDLKRPAVQSALSMWRPARPTP